LASLPSDRRKTNRLPGIAGCDEGLACVMSGEPFSMAVDDSLVP
jgi:hypothetical protein